MAGTFNTTFVTELKFTILKLNHIIEIDAKCHLTNTLLNYDLIIGRNIIYELGLLFNFKNKTITWQEFSIAM